MRSALSHQQLLDALGQVYARLTLVNLDPNTIHILHNASQPEEVGCDCNYDEYLDQYAGILSKTTGEYREQLRSDKLKAIFMAGRDHWDLVTSDTSIKYIFYRDAQSKQLMAICYLYLPKKQMSDMMHQITTNMLFKFCDYFLLVDPFCDSYYTFAASNANTPLHPKFSDSYSAEIIRYTKEHVAPPDQALVLREMSLPRVITELNRHGVHYFYAGVMEPGHGYARKRVEFRYCGQDRTMILLTRIDVSDLWAEQEERESKLLNALELAYTDHITLLYNEQGFAVQCAERLQHIKNLMPRVALSRSAMNQASRALTATAHSLMGHVPSHESAEPAVAHFATLILIKLNDLSAIKHHYGKEAVRTLLKHVAQLLRQTIAANYLIGRITDEVFGIFMTLDCDNNNKGIDDIAPCLKLAQDIAATIPTLDVPSICAAVAEPKPAAEPQAEQSAGHSAAAERLSCAIGIVKVPQDGCEYPELLEIGKRRTLASCRLEPNSIVAADTD